jgi:hypothetical protein
MEKEDVNGKKGARMFQKKVMILSIHSLCLRLTDFAGITDLTN